MGSEEATVETKPPLHIGGSDDGGGSVASDAATLHAYSFPILHMWD